MSASNSPGGLLTRVRLHEEQCRIERLRHQARLAELRRMPYEEYLGTPEWKAVRYQKVREADYKCSTCGKKDRPLDVHHNCYERVGNERMSDLVVLCDFCHDLFHTTWRDAS